ncbi:hypothetical protein [Ferrimicrobium sp.]|uniref:hypothetical protein n=1 Tax=Ferrimicrobium sp. TaxID=2926050 RepID=UPI002606BAE4|nr:hypothetical protein [Ferrimicrobium sp.]
MQADYDPDKDTNGCEKYQLITIHGAKLTGTSGTLYSIAALALDLARSVVDSWAHVLNYHRDLFGLPEPVDATWLWDALIEVWVHEEEDNLPKPQLAPSGDLSRLRGALGRPPRARRDQ